MGSRFPWDDAPATVLAKMGTFRAAQPQNMTSGRRISTQVERPNKGRFRGATSQE